MTTTPKTAILVVRSGGEDEPCSVFLFYDPVPAEVERDLELAGANTMRPEGYEAEDRLDNAIYDGLWKPLKVPAEYDPGYQSPVGKIPMDGMLIRAVSNLG